MDIKQEVNEYDLVCAKCGEMFQDVEDLYCTNCQKYNKVVNGFVVYDDEENDDYKEIGGG